MKLIFYVCCFLIPVIIIFAGETKTAETKPTIEAKLVKSQNEPVVEEKLAPAAIPVVTEEEAEKLNAEAIEYSKPFFNVSKHIANGYKIIIKNKLKGFQTVRPTSKQETTLSSKGYNLEEFKRRQIPYEWILDIDGLPDSTFFSKSEDGFSLDTGNGNIRLLAQIHDSMRSSYFIEITIKNESQEKNCEIELGVQGTGAIKSGYSSIKKEMIYPAQEKNSSGK